MLRNHSVSLLGFGKGTGALFVVAAMTVAWLGLACAAQALDLVASYDMNEASWNGTAGEVKNSSVYGNLFNATDVGYPPGAPGTFNGSSQYVITPNLNSTGAFNSSTTVQISLNFNPTVNPAGGVFGGVLVSELGQPIINAGWHDSQIEVETNGAVMVSVWPQSKILDLGTAHAGANNSVELLYNSQTQTISGILNGVATSENFGARQSPVNNYNGTQYYAFGATESTSLGNPNFFNGSISNVQISTTPEPGSLTLLGIGAAGLVAWRRRKAAKVGRSAAVSA